MLKKTRCFLFCAAVALSADQAYAQHAKIDSLKRTLSSLISRPLSPSVDTATANALNDLSWEFRMQDDYAHAFEFAYKALFFSKNIRFRKAEGYAYHTMGLLLREQGNYPGALKNYFACLKIKEELNNKPQISNCNMEIAWVYRKEGDYKNALKFGETAWKVSDQINDKFDMANASMQIGAIYKDMGDYPKALASLNTSLKLEEEIGARLIGTHILIGEVYKLQGEYDKAKEFFYSSLKIAEGTEGVKSPSNGSIYYDLGEMSMKLHDLAAAEKYYKKGIALSNQLGLKESIKENYYGLAALDSIREDYRSAFENFKYYIAYKDSLLNEQNTKRITQVQMQYDFDKKQAADSTRNAEQMKQEQTRHDQEIAQQKTYTYGGMIGFALMLVIAVSSFRAYRQKQKANEIISEQKQLVEAKQKEILDSIYYAQRIQNNILPTKKYIDKHLRRFTRHA